MYNGINIAIVVPAFNEEDFISSVINSVPDFADYIIIVDDASADKTLSVVEHSQRRNIFIEKHSVNGGVGSAIVDGYKRAIALGADIVVVMAGDAQMSPDDLPSLLEPLSSGEADYVKGNRFSSFVNLRSMPGLRIVGNFTLSIITKVVSGYWGIFDSQCGYTAISRNALLSIDLDRLYKRYGFPNHILIMLNAHNFRVKDVPVKAIYAGERSKLKILPFIARIIYLLPKWYIWRIFFKYDLLKCRY